MLALEVIIVKISMEGGSCTFHLLVKCSWKNCEADFDGFYSELKCSGEDSAHVLTCQFHTLAYEIECTKRVILISLSPHLVFSQNLGPRTLICTWNNTILQQIWGGYSPIWLGATEIEDQGTTGSQDCTPKWVYLSLMAFRKWCVVCWMTFCEELTKARFIHHFW